jgi:hypothetical protein
MTKYGWNRVFVGGKWNKICYIYRKQWLSLWKLQ